MNPLKDAVLLMTKDEVRAFKLFANRTGTQEERQDLALFDYIRHSGSDYEEKTIRKELYPQEASNAFHRLKSRLLQEVNRSLANQYLEKYDALKLYHFLAVIEFYLRKKHFGLAHWFLRKAERLAVKMSHYEGLDIIYTEYIRLSNEGLITDPEEYIRLRKENQKALHQVRLLDDVLAMVTHRVKVTQTFGESGGELMDLLEATVEEFSGVEAIQRSPKARVKMFQAISTILLDKRDYPALETYCRQTYESFDKDDLFNKSTHRVKLQMLTYIVNSLQKNQDAEGAIYYARRLFAAAKAYDNLYYKDFVFFYFNAMVVSYFQLDIDKAIEILKEMESDPIILTNPYYVLFIYLNLALAYNDKEQYKTSLKQFVRLYLHDSWKIAAKPMALRIVVAELIVRVKAREDEVLVSRVRQFKQDFKSELRQATFKREKALVDLLEKLDLTLDPHKDEALCKEARKFVALARTSSETEAELIEYDPFLKKTFRL